MSKNRFSTKYDRHEVKGICFDDETLTQQHCIAECDINNILKRYQNTGSLPELIKQSPQYGDFSTVADYQSSLNIVLMAQAQFESLSAEVRERFANSPDRFLSFCEDPKNHDEMVRMGLAVAKKVNSVDSESVSAITEPVSTITGGV